MGIVRATQPAPVYRPPRFGESTGEYRAYQDGVDRALQAHARGHRRSKGRIAPGRSRPAPAAAARRPTASTPPSGSTQRDTTP